VVPVEKVRGGILVARALVAQGVDRVFTLSGGFINPILEGLMLENIRIVNAPHEQIAGHLADGWARVTRNAAVCLVGPEGFGNAVPAMLEAYGQHSPIVFITGSSTLKRRGQGGFKEVDHVRIAEGLTKYSVLVTDGARIDHFIQKAFEIALGGTPGPVHVSIPTDLLYSSYEIKPPREERPFHVVAADPPIAWPDAKAVRELVELVSTARKPVLVAGNGVWWGRAENELAALADSLDIPLLVVPYHQALFGNVACRSYCGLADVHQYPPAEHALQNADLIVAIGCRLDNMLNFGNPPFVPATARLVSINASSDAVADNFAADLNILGHPRAVLSELRLHIKPSGSHPRAAWVKQNRDKRSNWVAQLRRLTESESSSAPMHPLVVALTVLEALGKDDYLVIDGGDTHYWAEMALNIAEFEGKHLSGVFHPGPYSLLGCGVAFGTAIKMRHPDHRVVVLSGDGAFLSSGLSIETAFHERLPITIVVDNNRGLGSIAQQQRRVWQSGRSSGTEFRDIPFDGLVRGLGGYGESVSDSRGLLKALSKALVSDVPACVNVSSKSVISPLVEALTDRRAKASIE